MRELRFQPADAERAIDELLRDGRVRVETSGDFDSLFRRYDIRCAYVPDDSLVTMRLLESGGWTPLFRDTDWAVLAATPR